MKKQSILFLCLTLSTILSAQVSKTVNCTAGTLSSLLSASEKNTVTYLTLTGTIDARDFKIMRDSMPKLTNIDMGTVTIAAYQNNLANQIPAGAFWDTIKYVSAPNLKSIVMPTSITNIGMQAFFKCSSLIGNLTIPNSVTSIGVGAFCGCEGFSGNLTIPNSVTSIGDNAFANCKGFISSLSIPNSVTNIGNYAFCGCTGFTGDLTIPNSVTFIGDYAFSECSGMTGNLTISNSVKSIGKYAFKQCSGFKGKLIIPSSVTSIESGTFSSCSGFTGNLTIPNSVKTIGDLAFEFCSGLTSISANVDHECYASLDGILYNKEKITLLLCPPGKSGSIIIPNSVCYINSYAFWSCSGLTSITAQGMIPINLNFSYYVFGEVNNTSCILYVPKGSKSAYQSANQWKDFKNIVEYDPNGINDISDDGTSLYVTDGQLHIKNAPMGEKVNITTASGMPVYSGIITTDVQSVSLPQSGVYIVTIGNKSQKVAY